jgi:hypothetical protein
MPIRLLSYIGALYQDLIASKKSATLKSFHLTHSGIVTSLSVATALLVN